MMLEAFERHLKQHNISKQFEEAKTKEEKIEACKKFLESEGLSVRPNLDPESQLKEARKNNTIQNTLVLGGGGAGGIGSLTIDPHTISGKVLPTWQPSTPNNPITYIQASRKMSQFDVEDLFRNEDELKMFIMDELSGQLMKMLKQYIVDKNLIKSETNLATLDKHYAVKIGIVG